MGQTEKPSEAVGREIFPGQNEQMRLPGYGPVYMGRVVHDLWNSTIAVEGSCFVRCVYSFTDAVFPLLYEADDIYAFLYAGVYDNVHADTPLLKYADFRGAKRKTLYNNDVGCYDCGADYCTGNCHGGFIRGIDGNYAGYYTARQHLYFSRSEYRTCLCSSIDNTHCFDFSVDFLQKANFYGIVNYAAGHAAILHRSHLAQAVGCSNAKSSLYCKSAGLKLAYLCAGFAPHLHEAMPGRPGSYILICQVI